METVQLFHNSLEVEFVSRPNRYTVIVRTKDHLRKITAYCPNPGRLIEIFVPGTTLILEHSKTGISKRKTEYTVVAAYYKGVIVPLYSVRANMIAEKLIIPKLFPRYTAIKREVTIDNSRIDFLVTERADKNASYNYIEVKACTLIEHSIAMFPDAPTIRGKKHIVELTKLSSMPAQPNRAIGNARSHVIFVIMNPKAKLFIPNMHTDINFARQMEIARNHIKFNAASVKSDKNGLTRIFNPNIRIDWESTKKNTINRGAYMLSIHIKQNKTIDVGSLGTVLFKRGFYIYVGSGLNNLDKRISRHKKRQKTIKWHIDYLTISADSIKDYPIRTSRALECLLAREISKISENYIEKFGSSDCNCPSHLFYFSSNPEMNNKFLDILFRFRHKEAFS